MKRIYFDNAATSWPKPSAVPEAVSHYFEALGTSAGRGSYQQAVEVDRLVKETRHKAAKLLGCNNDSQVVFTLNCTDALNLVLHGLLKPNDHVVTTRLEHNSVVRPLSFLTEKQNIEVDYIAPNHLGVVEPQAIKKAVRGNTKLLVISHASNVTGQIQPVEEIVKIAHDADVKVLVDAAQTAGHVPIDVDAMNIDCLATSGHKGLLGPLGTGLLYLAAGLEEEIDSYRQGGTGTVSEKLVQPEMMPQKYESGSPNIPGILGLNAALGYLEEHGVSKIKAATEELLRRLLDGLHNLPGVTTYAPDDLSQNSGVVSFNIDGYSPQDVASILDSSFSIQVRSGLHCSPLMHQHLGTFELGGTVRVSIGAFNTEDDVAELISALKQIAI